MCARDSTRGNANPGSIGASGHPVAVTVSFDDAAYVTYPHWDTSQKQLALGRLADGFSRMMSSRSPAALAGDYHVERF